MDAIEYLKAKNRMSNDCKMNCLECLFWSISETTNICRIKIETNPEKAVAIAEKWAKENPVKTYKSVFFEKFPNAKKDRQGYPLVWIENIFGGTSVGTCDSKTWDQEYKDPRP